MPPHMPNTLPHPLYIGWIGAGVMGSAMCGHLLRHGLSVTIFSRTKQKAHYLIDQGAQWADSPQSVAHASNVIITMVGYPHDVREIYLGRNGLLRESSPHNFLVDMTTSSPKLAQEIYQAGKEKEVTCVDAPVSGGDVGAQNGTLSIMAGGDEKAVTALRPIFERFGKTITYQGESGSGQHTKLCNQIVIAGTMIGVCESLLYGYKTGLTLDTMLESIRGGAAACWTLDNLAPRILRRDFDPGFFIEHFVKDMGIVLEEATRRDLSLPGLTLVHQLYQSLQTKGHGRSGTQALLLALEDMATTH